MRSEISIQSADAPNDSVEELFFALERGADGLVTITAEMRPTEDVPSDVIDGDSFPQFIGTVSPEEYRRLREIFVGFQT